MFTQTITPAFCETDALGHISNTVIPRWFESARDPVFRLFSPDLNPEKWQLILAKYELEFKSELFYGLPVEIRTWIGQLGNSSMHIKQQVWQKGRLTVEGTTVMVHFDYNQKKSRPISDEIKASLKPHIYLKRYRIRFFNLLKIIRIWVIILFYEKVSSQQRTSFRITYRA